MTDFLSNASADAPIHDIAWFAGFYEPIPSAMEPCLTADAIIEAVAPASGPKLVMDKHAVTYFLCARLRHAPFVATTAEKYPGESGFQRSASHTVHGAWFPFDLDGLSVEAWKRVWSTLIASGVKFCAFSSYSHGAAEKPGIRVRILLFMNRALEPADWTRAWIVVNEHLLLGLADKATSKLHQQAGVWATHPSRASQVFRHAQEGVLLSADKLLQTFEEEAHKKQGNESRSSPLAKVWNAVSTGKPTTTRTPSPRGGRVGRKRLERALSWLDASDYEVWKSACLGLQAAALLGHIPNDEGRSLWLKFSDGADEQAKAHNTDRRYDPKVLWEQMVPTAAPLEGLLGKLLAQARDQAAQHVRNARAINVAKPEAIRAAKYLGMYHPAMIEQILGTH